MTSELFRLPADAATVASALVPTPFARTQVLGLNIDATESPRTH